MPVCMLPCDHSLHVIDHHSQDCGWVFAQHFCNRLGPAYLHLKNALDESNPAHAEVLNDIKRRFREETFTRESIAQVIHAHSELVGFYIMSNAVFSHEAIRSVCSMSTLRWSTTQRLMTPPSCELLCDSALKS